MTKNNHPTATFDVDMNPGFIDASKAFRTRSYEFEQKMVFLVTAITGATITLLCPLYFSGSIEDARRWVVLFTICTSVLSFIISIFTSIDFGRYLDRRAVEYLKKGNAYATLRELKKTIRTLKHTQTKIDNASESQLLKQADFIKVSDSEGRSFEYLANEAEQKSQWKFSMSVIVYCAGIGCSSIAMVTLEVTGIL